MFSVEESVPDRASVLLTVRVLLVVPPATVKPVAAAVSVNGGNAPYTTTDFNALLPPR